MTRTLRVLRALRTPGLIAGALLAGGAALLAQTARPARPADVVKEPTTMPAPSPDGKKPAGPLGFTVKNIDGSEQNLAEYKGKVVMIVNVASRCGYTKQYTGLQALYDQYKDQGFVILGFPANNFKGQEPGTDAEIKEFCSNKYNVTFPMMSKVSVAGDDKTPVYQFLTGKETAGDFSGEIGWNFTKFLVDRNGNLMARFATQTAPEDPKVAAAIEKGLKAKGPDNGVEAAEVTGTREKDHETKDKK